MPFFGKKNFETPPPGQAEATGGAYVPTRQVPRGGADHQTAAEDSTRSDSSFQASVPAVNQRPPAAAQSTQLHWRNTPQPAHDLPAPGSDQQEPMKDPVVGWLVILSGPGRGASRALGYNMNTIGRAPESRVRLDFGDENISRVKHAILTYDPRGRKYYLQHGDSVNLTYIDDQPVLAATPLQGGEEILLGNTRLRFIPLCGPGFDWQDGP